MLQPETLKKEYEENDKSPRNIKLITEYIKNNLKNYYQYMMKNGTDLKYVLQEIKKEKKNHDIMVHNQEKSFEKYIKLMSQNNIDLGKKIEFIFRSSPLIMDYVFKKDNKIKESEIFNEFKEIEETIKKKNEETSKNIKEC
jgi:glutamyl/glutaminyl-tRNA synthetase